MGVTEEILNIEKELKVYNHIISQAKQTILDQDVTKYPIFVASKSKIELGISLIDREKTTAIWSINASSLEEFVAKNIVNAGKIEDFKKTFKNVETYNCYFIVSDIGNQFAFLPVLTKPT